MDKQRVLSYLDGYMQKKAEMSKFEGEASPYGAIATYKNKKYLPKPDLEKQVNISRLKTILNERQIRQWADPYNVATRTLDVDVNPLHQDSNSDDPVRGRAGTWYGQPNPTYTAMQPYDSTKLQHPLQRAYAKMSPPSRAMSIYSPKAQEQMSYRASIEDKQVKAGSLKEQLDEARAQAQALGAK
jgi:hypothetical protein